LRLRLDKASTAVTTYSLSCSNKRRNSSTTI
jgi:hypothetical protein